MGEGTFVSKKNKKGNNIRNIQLPFDVPLLLVVAMLLVFGLLMVYSSSWEISLDMGEEPTYIFKRQVIWVILGIVSAVIFSYIDYHLFEKVLLPMAAVTWILLIAVLIVGNNRFLSARGLISGSIQPSELAKVATIIYLSFWLHRRKDILNDTKLAFYPLVIILGVTVGLIILQPDLSAGLTVLFLGIMLFFLAGGDWKIILKVIVLAIIGGAPLVLLYPTGRNRIIGYIDSLYDPLTGSYHFQRSMEAVIKGGWFGVGIGQAESKFDIVPLPATDSIFAVIAEETGILGALIMVILFGVFIWRGLAIAKKAPDQLGSLIAFGLTAWIGLEAFLNMAVILGLLPHTGNALPFFSAGGSNMLMVMTSIGIIINISRASLKQKKAERSPQSAVVDLRRRDGRRRVPRHNRS